jgi:hypothetical protein
VLGHGAPFFAGVTPKLRLVGSERIGESALKLTYAPGVDSPSPLRRGG